MFSGELKKRDLLGLSLIPTSLMVRLSLSTHNFHFFFFIFQRYNTNKMP